MLMTGSQIVLEVLAEEKVDTVFGYPGGTILNVYDALYDNQLGIRHFITAHEQGAAHAADGYARATGKTGVVFATSGPGSTNLVTGIATAYMDSIPMVAITAQRPQRTDRLGQLPGGLYHRHHDADYQAQFRCAQGRGSGRYDPSGVFHRQFRQARPGAGRYSQGCDRRLLRVSSRSRPGGARTSPPRLTGGDRRGRRADQRGRTSGDPLRRRGDRFRCIAAHL